MCARITSWVRVPGVMVPCIQWVCTYQHWFREHNARSRVTSPPSVQRRPRECLLPTSILMGCTDGMQPTTRPTTANTSNSHTDRPRTFARVPVSGVAPVVHSGADARMEGGRALLCMRVCEYVTCHPKALESTKVHCRLRMPSQRRSDWMVTHARAPMLCACTSR